MYYFIYKSLLTFIYQRLCSTNGNAIGRYCIIRGDDVSTAESRWRAGRRRRRNDVWTTTKRRRQEGRYDDGSNMRNGRTATTTTMTMTRDVRTMTSEARRQDGYIRMTAA